MRTPYWTGVVLVPVIFLIAMRFIDRSPSIDQSLLRSTALVVVSKADQPPDFSQAKRPVELPHRTRVDDTGIAGAWHQVDIEPADSRELWAVYLPFTHSNFEVRVNGEVVGISAPMTWPYAFFRKPLYFEFSSSLLRSTSNTVHVRLMGVRHAGWMYPFYVGPARALKPSYDYTTFVYVTLKQATIAALGVLSLLLLGLVWVRPAETAYAWFAAANLCWAACNYLNLEPRILIPNPGVWFALPIIAIGWFSICSAHFIHRLPSCGGPQPRWENGFLMFGVLGTCSIVAQRMLSLTQDWVEAYIWLPGAMLINVYLVWRLALAVRRSSSFETRLWLLAVVLILVVGTRDYLTDMTPLLNRPILYLSYTVSLVLLVFGVTLVSRVTRALTEAETLNRELENRVAMKGRELARNYERLQGLERERAISSERERMTTDMHDGIGGQLIHALAVIERNPAYEPLEPILRGALDDLRLIIDSADPTEGDLLVVLSNFRARNERRVQAGGLRFLWQVTDLPQLDDFGPHKVLQVLRVLQEALTNVLKHAGATEVIVRTGSAADAQGRATIVVDVVDDGVGYEQNASDGNLPGRGINNMHRRARELGGSIEFSTAPTGSRVRLILPVDAKARA